MNARAFSVMSVRDITYLGNIRMYMRKLKLCVRAVAMLAGQTNLPLLEQYSFSSCLSLKLSVTFSTFPDRDLDNNKIYELEELIKKTEKGRLFKGKSLRT